MALNQLIPVASASALEAAEETKRAAEKRQSSALVQGLAAHVKKRWESVRDSRSDVEERLASCLRQRNGEYDPTKLAEIRKVGGSEIFMGLTSTKCRGASSWLRDTLLGTGTNKPWALESTPIPDLPPEVQAQIQTQLTSQVMEFMMATGGMPPPIEQVKELATKMRDQAYVAGQQQARERVDRMEVKMEDQLAEGGFLAALSQFIDDVVTFPTAIMKGPVVRKRTKLQWNGTILEPVETTVLEWERVDPFKFYPAPWASSVNDGFVIERHRLTKSDLESLIGVEGYSEGEIRAVLSEAATGGLGDWLSVDSVQADAEGKDMSSVSNGADELIEALQLWDEVSGKLLVEWGMLETDVPDQDKTYPCEVWLVGSRVIKAVLNYDPLGRKPYYATSYEKIPGAFWGNGVADLVRDCQQMCNAAARALSNNMGISSGPQVGVNVSRLPPGEQITSMYPWKEWKYIDSDYQGSSKPLDFFQPNSNAQELMAVFDRFMVLADEISGIPRYMTGENAPGAGRTASGLSMLISNASKGLKQVISNIDRDVLTLMLERQYQHNLRYSQDSDLIGDVNIVAKGAMSLVAKEAAQVRRTEFLQLALQAPIVQQIIGVKGVAELLRDAAKMLDFPQDTIVPSKDQINQMVAQQAMMQQIMMEQAMNPEYEDVQFQRDEKGAVTGATKRKPKQLQADGTPQGGREGSLMVNRITGANGVGGKG